jgi:hypothetical protein
MMNLQSLTEALVMRGYCKCDSEGDGDVRVHTPPAGGHYWHLLPAHQSEDGTAWLWVSPPQERDTDLDLAFQADADGTLLSAGIQDMCGGWEVVTLCPVPASFDAALALWTAVAAIYTEAFAGKADLSNKALAALLDDGRLPEGAYVSRDMEEAA